MVANADGSNERTLTVRKGMEWFSPSGPSWSPDGNTIACSAGGTDSDGATFMTVMGYSLRDGSLKPLTSQKWSGEVRRLLWLPDAKGLIVPAQSTAQFLSRTQLYLLSQPDGEVTRITNDLNGYGNVSLGLTADGSTVVTVQSVPSVQLWTTNLGEPSNRAVQISHGEVRNVRGSHGENLSAYPLEPQLVTGLFDAKNRSRRRLLKYDEIPALVQDAINRHSRWLRK